MTCKITVSLPNGEILAETEVTPKKNGDLYTAITETSDSVRRKLGNDKTFEIKITNVPIGFPFI